MDNHPVSANLLGLFFHVDGKQLQEQYKNHLSDFHDWDQKHHAENWTLFPQNISEHLSIDETSFSNGDLYTIVSSKSAKGRKGTILATIKGTKAEDIIRVLERIPSRSRNKVREVTMDMAPNMAKAIRRCFRNSRHVIDRFHVQKLAYDAVQELRIKYRWEVWMRKVGQSLRPESRTILMNPSYCQTEIPSKNFWPDQDTSCLNILADGQKVKNTERSSCFYDSLN